jgi:hemolysin III
MLTSARENGVPGEEPTTGDGGPTRSALPGPLSAVVSAPALVQTAGPAAGGPSPSSGQRRSAPASMLLYDSRRDVHYEKPLLRGWLHLLWFEASLVAGTLLVVAVHGLTHRIAVAIYAGCLSGLFGVSALYHRGNWGPSAMRVLQRADHVMILLLIAGTATPVFLLAVPGTFGVVSLIVLWSVTAVMTGAHLLRMKAPERLVGGAFIGLGAVNVLALPALWSNVGVAAAVLVMAGGLLYVIGATAYHFRRPDPFPCVFGYHEVFHAFVCAAATCHFVAIALLAG